MTGYAIGPQGTNDDLITYIATDGTTLYTLWQTGNNSARPSSPSPRISRRTT